MTRLAHGLAVLLTTLACALEGWAGRLDRRPPRPLFPLNRLERARAEHRLMRRRPF
jgi:hypothetical protein